MAWQWHEDNVLYSGCGYSQNSAIDWWMDWANWVWQRDTNNCEYAKPKVDVKMKCTWYRLGWASASGVVRLATQCDYFDGNSGVYDHTEGKGGSQCPPNPITYGMTTHYGVTGHVKAGVTTLGYWWIWGFTPTSSGADWQWLAKYDYSLPTNMRVLPPEDLSVSFPSTLGGTTSASISKWSANTNIGGTPTSYPNAKYWNWALDLLDTSGNYLAHKCLNRYETKSASWSGDYNFYTASTLYPSSYYSTKKNTGYKLRVVVNNNMNQQLSQTSSTIYTAPPSPTVTITSCVYNPGTKSCQLSFDWSKPSDGGALTETIKYDLYDAAGNYYKSGVTLATTSTGAAKSGSITVTGLPSGEQYIVKVTVSTSKGSANDTDSVHAPVANAAFLGFDWDELRRTVVIRAEAPGAANCRIQAGDKPNVYNLGNKLTSGEIGTITLKDLPHGDGQTLYLQAVPEASDGYQYTNEIAKVTVPVPNPIIGVLTPSCGSAEEQRYIVDIVEKKADCTVTPKWQVGDRVVTKDPCLPDTPPFVSIVCVDDSHAPYPNPNPIPQDQNFYNLGSLPAPYYRDYEIEFNPGWNKNNVFSEREPLDVPYPSDIEWLSDTRVRVTFTPWYGTPPMAYLIFNMADGGKVSILVQQEVSEVERTYVEDWWVNKADGTLVQRIALAP